MKGMIIGRDNFIVLKVIQKYSFYSRLLVIGLMVSLSSCVSVPENPFLVSFSQDINARVEEGLAALEVVQGVSIAVYTPDGAYIQGYGVADIETGEPVSDETAFYIASSTKPLTALAMSLLHHRGEIDLDSTLAEFAPDAKFPFETKPDDVTLRDLLSQSSGLRNDSVQFRLAFTGQHTPDLLWRLLDNTTAYEKYPLGTFRYSNTNFNILTILSDKKLGEHWKDILAEEIFDKAGMTRSTAYMSRANNEGWSVAHPHETLGPNAPQRVTVKRLKTDATMQSAGGVIMSAADAALWLEAMVESGRIGGRQVFPVEAIATTIEPRVTVNKKYYNYQRDHYGLGWYIGRYGDDTLVHHLGGFAGARAHVSFMPYRKTGVAVFVNDSGAGAPLADAIANYAYDSLAKNPNAKINYQKALRKAVKRRDTFEKRQEASRAKREKRTSQLSLPLEAYAGKYVNEFGESFEISVMEEGLHVSKGGSIGLSEPYIVSEAVRIEPIPGIGAVIKFGLAEKNTVDRLTFLDEEYKKEVSNFGQ